MTGTVGSEHTIKFLSELYNASVVKVPPFKRSQMQFHENVIVSKKEDWFREIVKKVCFDLNCASP